jgi:hypothetical protein
MAGEPPGEFRGRNLTAHPVSIIKCGYMTGATKLYATGTIFKKNSRMKTKVEKK